jgi:hypothetical protein
MGEVTRAMTEEAVRTLAAMAQRSSLCFAKSPQQLALASEGLKSVGSSPLG